MAELYGPFDGGTFAEDNWYRMMRAAANDGVIYQYASEVTTPYTGPAANGLRVTLAGALDISLGVGAAFVRGGMYENTASLTKTVSTPPTTAGQSRRDLLVARLDRTANTCVAVIIPGTAATSPVDPPLLKTPTQWDVPFGRVLVPANAVNLATVQDMRHWSYLPPELSMGTVVSGTTDANSDITVTHNLGIIPGQIFLQDHSVLGGAPRALQYHTVGVNSFKVRCYYNNVPAGASNPNWSFDWNLFV